MKKKTRPRVSAAIFRDDCILMVHHIHDGFDYWTFPGGAVENCESLHDAVIREVLEETNLHINVGRFLYEEAYSQGINYCFEALEIGEGEIQLGFDPEDAHKTPKERILQDIAWRPLAYVKNDRHVRKVLDIMKTGDSHA